MSQSNGVAAENIRSILLYISTLERSRFTQEQFAKLCGVHLKSVNKWVNGREITRNALAAVADGIERYFGSERVRVAPDDVANQGLVERIREQLEERVAGEGPVGQTASHKSLSKLLDDETAVRILGIDAALRGWLLEQVGNFRADLTDQDWAEVVRLIREGRWDEDGYLFMDPHVVTARLHFKLPPGKLLTDRERWKIQKIAQQALDDLWREKKES